MNPWQSEDYAESYRSRHGKYPPGYNSDAQTAPEAGDDQDIDEEWNRHCNGKAAEALHPIDPAEFLLESEPEPKVVASHDLEDTFQSLLDERSSGLSELTPKPERKAASQTLRQPVAETVTRLIEESRNKRKTVTAKQYKQATKFEVGSEIDEAGLSAIEFQIYAHLVRRANANRECFPSLNDICRYCKCERKTAIKAIEVLETRRFIACQKRFHKPTLYKLRKAEDWCSLTVNESTDNTL
jgi:Helix-turn-helix domain